MSQEIPLISNSWSNDLGQIWKKQHLTKELSCRNHIKSQILETVLGQFEKMPPIFHILNSVGGWITYIHVTTISQHFGGLTFLTSCKGRQVYRGHLGRISSTVWPGATATTTGFCLLEACCWRVYSQSYLSYKTHSVCKNHGSFRPFVDKWCQEAICNDRQGCGQRATYTTNHLKIDLQVSLFDGKMLVTTAVVRFSLDLLLCGLMRSNFLVENKSLPPGKRTRPKNLSSE